MRDAVNLNCLFGDPGGRGVHYPVSGISYASSWIVIKGAKWLKECFQSANTSICHAEDLFFFFFLSWSYYSEVLSYYLTLLCVGGCWWDVNEDNDNFKLLFWRSVPAVRTRKHHPLTQSLRHVPLLPSSLVKPATKGAPAWASQGRISCSCFPYP